MTLRVFHVLVPEPPGEVGGADMHVRDLAVAQLAAGLNAVVIERGSTEFADRLTTAGVEVVSATGLRFRAAIHFLAREIARRRPHVVHAHGYDADYWAAATRWRFPRLFKARRLVFTQHGIVEDTLWHRCKTALDAVCMRAADGIIVCAPDLVRRMQRWSSRADVRYIPNGVEVPPVPPSDAARRALGLPLDGIRVAYIGRLSPEKRPDRVLTLVADARAAGLAVSAVISGSGLLREDLERQADALGIREAVRFTGLMFPIGLVYGAVDALALLSDTETTSRVVIEAMSTGVPVLATAVGGVPELLDHGRAGWLVPPGDRKAAVTALRELIAEPHRFVNVARQRAAEHFGIGTMTRSVTTFYEHLLAGRTPVNDALVTNVSDRA